MTFIAKQAVAKKVRPHPIDSSTSGPGELVLVFQGGGALGAYQAGVFEALSDAEIEPDWVAGISIGAINSALIAGNPPERRVSRLKEFWELISSAWPALTWFDDGRGRRHPLDEEDGRTLTGVVSGSGGMGWQPF